MLGDGNQQAYFFQIRSYAKPFECLKLVLVTTGDGKQSLMVIPC